MKNKFFHLFVIASALTVGVVAVRAQDLNAVKGRMEQRLSKLDALKEQGVIGENNRGLVELRGGNAEAGDVVAGENSDRGVVYAAIAKQTGSSAEAVGKARAKQIAAGSAAGVWLQRDNGDWYKK